MSLSFPIIVFSKNYNVGFFYPDDSNNNKSIILNIINGIKESAPNFKFIELEDSNLNSVDLILVFSVNDYEKVQKSKKKIFTFNMNNHLDTLQDKNIIGVFIPKLPYYKIIMKIKNTFNNINRIGVVLHNKKIIKDISRLRIYNPFVKIYEVTNRETILYTFNKALENNDFILLLPDKFVFNYFSFQKIIRILNRDEALFGGFAKTFLKYGAVIAFEIDYFEAGKKVGKFLNNTDLKSLKNSVKFYPANVRYYLNK